MVPETRVFQEADDEDLVIPACTVFDWSTCVTDRRTDRQNCNSQDALKAVASVVDKKCYTLVFYSDSRSVMVSKTNSIDYGYKMQAWLQKFFTCR